MRQYECMYILDPALPEDELGTLSERFRKLVGDQGGTVDGLDRWERRRLAYEVKGKREGIYVVMNFTANPGVESELQRVLRLTDGVLRHMVVRLDDAALKHLKAQAAKSVPPTQVAAPPQVTPTVPTQTPAPPTTADLAESETDKATEEEPASTDEEAVAG